jgi:hypothetical protein
MVMLPHENKRRRCKATPLLLGLTIAFDYWLYANHDLLDTDKHAS